MQSPLYVKIRNILLETAYEHGVTMEELETIGKWKPVLDARRKVVFRLHTETPLSFRRIAIRLKHKHKSTIEQLFKTYIRINNLTTPPKGWKNLKSLVRDDSPELPF